MSRPTGSKNEKDSVKYSKKLFNNICERIAAGESLRAICREDGYPTHSAVIQWVMSDKDNCSNQYGKAREVQAQAMVEELFDIVDDGTRDDKELANGNVVMDKEWVARSRLRFDARRWYISKVLPKIYGDKLNLTHDGNVNLDVNVTEIRRVIVDPVTE